MVLKGCRSFLWTFVRLLYVLSCTEVLGSSEAFLYLFRCAITILKVLRRSLTFWGVLRRYRVFWGVLIHSKQFWGVLGHSWNFCWVLRNFRVFWAVLIDFWRIWVVLWHSGWFSRFSEVFWGIVIGSEPFSTVLARILFVPLTFWDVLRLFEVFSWVLNSSISLLKNLRHFLMFDGYFEVIWGVLKHFHRFWMVMKDSWTFWSIL